MAEMSYEFIANMVRSSAGTEGMKFFPFVFSLFMFILVANLFGMFPYFFTVTSHIIVTVALALMVFGRRRDLRLHAKRPQVPQAVRAVTASPGTSCGWW